MKRSEINKLICQAKVFFEKNHFKLPPFAYWTPEDWKSRGPETDEIRDSALGWDLTDFGSGDYNKVGLFLFTLRNGLYSDNAGKSYAEKIMICQPGQVTPWHFHKAKMEDIICRGGADLWIEVSNVDAKDNRVNTDVELSLDGIKKKVSAGATIILTPGESITIPRGLAHSFYGDPHASEDSLVGEVSDVNDDNTDNYFLFPSGRFPKIDEDAPPIHYLCNEYPAGYRMSHRRIFELEKCSSSSTPKNVPAEPCNVEEKQI